MLISKKLAADLQSAEKIIFKFLGKVDELDYNEFYKIFCRGIFKESLLDMMNNIS